MARSEPVCLTEDARLSEAVDSLIRTGHSMLPIVSSDGKLNGVFSNREDISRFLMNLDVVPLAGSLLTWRDLEEVPGMSACGTPAPDESFGSILIAINGDDGWIETAEQSDVLICGDVAVLNLVPEDRRPSRVIVVSSAGEPSAEAIDDCRRNGTFVLHFDGNVSDLLRSLTRQIRLGTLELGPRDMRWPGRPAG